MKRNCEFGFLARECPLVSRELVSPWRLSALAVGVAILIAESHLTPSADWDYPICFIMGLWAYVFAPVSSHCPTQCQHPMGIYFGKSAS